jgi:hypothetical protein
VSQSTFIAGALIAGFVLFLAARNRLSTYAAVLWGSTGAQVPATAPAAPMQGGNSSPLGSPDSNPLMQFLPDILGAVGG